MPSDAFIKDNELTRAMDYLSAQNRGKALGRGHSGQNLHHVSADPLPSVSTPNMRALDGEPPPLVSNLPPEEQARLALLAAQYTGEPVQEYIPPPSASPATYNIPPRSGLPNFARVQTIDLVNGVIVIDGLEFGMQRSDVTELKRWCVEAAMSAISTKLATALLEFEAEDAPITPEVQVEEPCSILDANSVADTSTEKTTSPIDQ